MVSWQKVALGFAIMAAFVAFVIFSVETLYKSPKYEDFSRNDPYPTTPIEGEAECIQLGGKWDKNDGYGSGPPILRPPVLPDGSAEVPMGWCDLHYEANQRWERARAFHDGVAAGIFALVGAVALFIGVAKLLPLSVGGGFAFGGVFLLIASIAQYGEHMNEYVRLVVIGAVLLIMVYAGFRYAGERTRQETS